jgi:hypothetical protein
MSDFSLISIKLDHLLNIFRRNTHSLITDNLLKQREHIRQLMFAGQYNQALTAMTLLMEELKIDDNDKEATQAKKDLIRNNTTPFIATRNVQYYFTIINNYLNKHYFK